MTYSSSNALVLTADHFAGVRTRRIIAVCIDLCVITALTVFAWILLGILGLPTFGLTWFLIPFAWPLIAFFYNGLTVSGSARGTWGMRLADIEVRMMQDGSRVSFIHAALQALLFYISWSFPFVFLISLIAADKRCLHDILSGVIVMRRSQ